MAGLVSERNDQGIEDHLDKWEHISSKSWGDPNIRSLEKLFLIPYNNVVTERSNLEHKNKERKKVKVISIEGRGKQGLRDVNCKCDGGSSREWSTDVWHILFLSDGPRPQTDVQRRWNDRTHDFFCCRYECQLFYPIQFPHYTFSKTSRNKKIFTHVFQRNWTHIASLLKVVQLVQEIVLFPKIVNSWTDYKI